MAIAVATAAVVGSCAVAQPAAKDKDNAVIRWNQVALEAIRITRTSPPVGARALAIVHTCMFDAWTAYDEAATGTRLGGSLRRPARERTIRNKELAVSAAAYRALVDVFPSQKATLLDPAAEALGLEAGKDSDDSATAAGVANVACNAVLEFRHHDGANQNGDLHDGAYSDYTGFTPANTVEVLRNRNRWQPLLVNGSPQRWLLPQWAVITPFALTSGAEFRAAVLTQGPYVYPSAAFWKQAEEVVDLSAQLGDREKTIAEYWADGAGTVTPPGHWNVIAQEVSRRDHHGLDEDVKMFFALNNALLDASIAAWDVKRYADSIRPVTVIRALLGNREMRAWAGPGLGVRMINCKNFRTYLPTPPFSSFVSGHSAFSAAGAEILKRFTGSDAFGGWFTAEPGSSLIEPGLTPTAAVTLSWATFSDAADEAGISRRWGGIHFESDDLAGRALGRMVADKVWNRAIGYIRGAAN
ncbi:MAG TPA: phosphoesterase [Candidatus Angelobacter sp.]|nr:phosphoesterase [Candidatus Angelobacter sp.]